MARFHLYSRRGCHLCEVMIEQLLVLLRGQVPLEIHDIDQNPEWLRKYGVSVPVLELEGRVVCAARLDEVAVAAVLEKLAND